MNVRNHRYGSFGDRILLIVLLMLFTLSAIPANSASEPGTVAIVFRAEPANLDPGDNLSSNVGMVVMKNIYEPLIEVNADDERIIPRLATSWKQVDKNTWHFTLRQGVKFHDGEDFNAQAVVFNIKRLYDKKLGSRTRDKIFSGVMIEGKALDSHTVELKTDKPEPLMLTLIRNLAICSPNTPVDKFTRRPIGTGPHKFVRWDAGVQIITERFDGYWGKQPQVKKAVYMWRNESSVRAAMVLIGEADIATDISQQDAKRPDLDHSYFDSNTTCIRIGGDWEPPLNDKRVRMALNYAVDRDAIKGSILGKDVVPATQMMVPSIFGYNPDLKVWPYDPQKAKQLLAEARKDGVPVDKEILIVDRAAYYAGSDEVTEAVVNMYRAVGLNVKSKTLEGGVFIAQRNKPFPKIGPYLWQMKFDNNFGDASFTTLSLYHCKSGVSSMCDSLVDDLIDKAQVATGEERRNLWRAASKRIHEEIIPNVMLFHLVSYCRVGNRINFKPSIATTNEIQLAQITFR
jgi:peptide/nickel transport system substrate-binding protein